jgi:hypothetical protein
MIETAMLRKELHSFIDIMPEQNLSALRPLMVVLVGVEESPVIETDLTDEEHNLIEEGMQRYREDPSSFVTLESVLEKINKR